MEINNPFRFKHLNNRANIKTEITKINKIKPKTKLVNHNIKSIWNDETIIQNNKLSPVKIKKKNLLLLEYYTNRRRKKRSIDNFDNTLYNNKKRSMFEDNFFIDKYKQKKIKYSLVNKETPKVKHNFYLNNVYFGFEQDNIEINKTPLINNQKYKDSDLFNNQNIEGRNIYNKLNQCYENYAENINDKALEEILKQQKRLLLSSTVNNTKIIHQKNIIDSTHTDDNNSLNKIIMIEPLKSNFINQNLKNKLSISYTQDNILKSGQNNNKIILPSLSINSHLNINKNKTPSEIAFNSIEENNKSMLTERYTSENKKEEKKINKKNKDINDGIFSPSTLTEKNKKLKIEFNSKLKTIICPPDYYTSDFYYYIVFPNNCGWLIKKCLAHRLKWKECHSNFTNLFNFKWKDVVSKRDFFDLGVKDTRPQLINHFEFHSCLSNKYNMFYNLSKYCELNCNDVFKYVPFTICFDCLNFDEFNIYKDNFKEIFNNINNYIFNNNSINNQTYNRKKIPYRDLFPIDKQKYGYKFYCEIPQSHYAGKNLWIVKAPNLNRGRCIKVFDNFNDIIKFLNEMRKGNVSQYENIREKGNKNEEIKEQINNDNKEKEKEKEKDKGDYQSNFIILQKYIEKPFLYYGRKFDIRIWVLISHKMDVYIFKEGHLKASSVNYSLDNNNSFVHLTNYSLQKYNKNFSKYEMGNEISFETFQAFLDTQGENSFNFKETIIPKFKSIIELTAKASKTIINRSKKNYSFEIFGYDFMMDEDRNVYLIEINTNPGLEISSKVIEILVPRMIDDALRLTIDELFQTKYTEDWTNHNGNYKSNYHVEGYDDTENMWEYICNINKSNEKFICEDYYGFGYTRNKKKKHHHKKSQVSN